MADLRSSSQPAMGKLLQSDPDQLYAELGLRQLAIQADPTQAGMIEPTATFDADFAGPMDVMKEMGQKFFARFSKDAYGLVCGADQENAEQRKSILDALGGGTAAFAAALSAAFVSWFGWAPAIAAVVAALVIRLFFKTGYGAMCDVWKEHLPG